jgi:malate dehydrogenase (oxaloacetate-decarboxylating)
MLLAAARGVADQSPCEVHNPNAGILPPLEDLHTVSRRIAAVVARAAVDAGVADRIDDSEIQRRIDDGWWDPAYSPIQLAAE